jgi:HK97 family phage prohead protease
MQRNFLDSPTEFKFAGDAGLVEGYASIFGNRDLGGDVVMPGAFQKFTRTRDGKTLMLYQHDQRSPIGKADVSPDSAGLHFKAQLVLADPTAKRAYTHMREGLLDGMSIGYEVLPGGSEYKGDRRELTALHLFEISAVTFGMNPLAHVETVKSAADCADVRELERLLREAPQFQFSSRKAKAAANALWPLIGDRDGRDDAREEREAEEKLTAIVARLHSLNSILTKG